MVQLSPYLTFNGNCREAMMFYASCFGGEPSFQTIGNSPLACEMPDNMKGYILHSVLTAGKLTLMATDCVPQDGLIPGNTVSLSVSCSSEREIRRLYEKLSSGGTQTYPLEDTFWGALFGGLTDRFGHSWLLNFNAGMKN